MSIYRVTPLAPAYVLLLGAALILIVGPALTPRRRHGLVVAISALALLSLFFVGGDYPADVQSLRTLIEWLDQPALALRVPPFEPYLWILMLSLLAISLAERRVIDRLSPLDQAMLFALTAVACGVVLAGNYRTLAFALLLFDATAALFALTTCHPGRADSGEVSRAVGRLLLGVLSSAAVIALAPGTDNLTVHPREMGGLFALTVWLRIGLYPLVESGASDESPWPMRLGWTIINLAVSLYLVPVDAAPWLVWLAGATMLLHGALAWLEPSQQRALAHLGYGLAGGILTTTAAVGVGPTLASSVGPSVVAASIGTLAALVALGLMPSAPVRGEWPRPQGVWVFLLPLLATASLIGVPFTLGWEGRGALYQATWAAGALGVLALIVVAEGAALSVLYRYWERLLGRGPAEAANTVDLEGQVSAEGTARPEEEVPATSSQGATSPPETDSDLRHQGDIWHLLGATLACVPFLLPVLGPLLVVGTLVTLAGPSTVSALLGLVGSLLWALFLGYGRRRLLDFLPFSWRGLAGALRLGWLLRTLGYALDRLGRVILRVRAVVEGEHYLAWAILLALGLGLAILLR